MFLKVDGAHSRKYALEGLHLISQVYAILSPRMHIGLFGIGLLKQSMAWVETYLLTWH
jgi:hypothetical protein